MLIRVIVWPTEARQHLQEPMASPHTLTHPLCSHSHRLWAFTRCHYFIVSLHACDRAVQLTLCCSSQASSRPAHWGQRGYWGGGLWVWDSPFPGQASLPAHLDPYTQSTTPSLYLLLHSSASPCVCVNSRWLLESVGTSEFGVIIIKFLLENF